MLARVFGGVGRGLGGIAVVLFFVTPFNSFVLVALCISTVVIAGIFVIVGEYFRNEDET